MSIREWIEARVPGGASSRLGRLLDVGYALEYGAPNDRPVGAQPRVPPRGAAARGAAVPHRHVRRALPDRGRQRRAAPSHRGSPAEGRGAASHAAPSARARGRRPSRPGLRDARWAEECPGRSCDPGAAVRRSPRPRLRPGRLRPAEAACHRGARHGTQLEASPPAGEPILAPAGRSAAGDRRRGDGSRSPPDLGVVARSVRREAASSSATGSTRRREPWPPRCPGGRGRPLARGGRGEIDARGPRDRVARSRGRVERAGDPVRALPRPEPERVVLVLPGRAVSGVRRLRGRPAAQRSLRGRAHVDGVPGVHGGGRRRGRAGGPSGPGRSPPREAAAAEARRR